MRDPSEDELDAWMSRLAQGDRAAFDPLFRALHPRALRLSGRKLAQDEAADAAQAILMKVFARASDFEVGKPVLPWFYAVAANELHAFARRGAALGRRKVDDSELVQHASATKDPEAHALDAELRVCLNRAIASLDEDSAEAIAKMLEEGPIPSVGAPAFRKRVSRAYAKLRLLLGGIHAR